MKVCILADVLKCETYEQAKTKEPVTTVVVAAGEVPLRITMEGFHSFMKFDSVVVRGELIVGAKGASWMAAGSKVELASRADEVFFDGAVSREGADAVVAASVKSEKK